MRAHVIENGIVVNTIVVDSLNDFPNLIDGSVGGIGWVYDGKTLTDPTAPTNEEITANAWGFVRADRNAFLSACDWTQLPDAPLTNVQMAAWAVYRQALRDITTQSDPFNIVWPQEPE